MTARARIQRHNSGPLTRICADCGGDCDSILQGFEAALGLKHEDEVINKEIEQLVDDVNGQTGEIE